MRASGRSQRFFQAEHNDKEYNGKIEGTHLP